MKKLLFFTIFIFAFSLAFPSFSFSQGMMGNMMGKNNTVLQSDDGHTAREEVEGKEIWERLQAKELSCEDLSDENFGALGEYFMGQMAGDSHETMNNMMIQMMGEEGEEEMHVAMGKRMSNCELNAAMPQNMMNSGMMAPLRQGFEGQGGGGNSIMGIFGSNPMGWSGFGFGWIFMILFWGLVILGIIALLKWLMNQGKGKSSLDILKERYAKGEINKKEFEEKKKDLS